MENKVMDLTKIEKPFGLLDTETQQALKAHIGPWEFYTYHGWEEVADPSWSNSTTYRATPGPQYFWVNIYPNSNGSEGYGPIWLEEGSAKKYAGAGSKLMKLQVVEE